MSAPRAYRTRALWLLAVGAYLAHQVAQRAGWALPWADAYLDDVLLLPVVLPPVALAFGWYYRRPARLNGPQVAFAAAYAALFFEVIVPYFHAGYIADPTDALAYAAGGLLYYACLRGPWFFAHAP